MDKIMENKRLRHNAHKYASLENLRAIRAVDKKALEKYKRQKNLSKLRGIGTPVESAKKPKVTRLQEETKKYSKEEMKVLSQQRYHNMLKWKEDRNRQLQKEKESRKPSFKTGLYKPDNLKILGGTDEDGVKKTKFTATPFKTANNTLIGSSVKTYIRSSQKSATFTGKPKKTRRTARLLFDQESTRPKREAKSRAIDYKDGRRNHLGNKTLGVAPLPITPLTSAQQTASRIINKSTNKLRKTPSFAPKGFAFQAPAGLDLYDLKKKIEFLQQDRPNIKNSNNNQPASSSDALNHSKLQSHETSSENCSTNGINIESVNENHAENLEKSESCEEPVVVENIVEEVSETSNLTSALHENPASSDTIPTVCVSPTKSTPENSPQKLSPMENRSLIMNAGATPGPKTRNRRKAESKDFVTPPLARLRPRTPCSRSTRRSMKAHCDAQAFTPCCQIETPNRRKSKRVTLCTPVAINTGYQNEMDTVPPIAEEPPKASSKKRGRKSRAAKNQDQSNPGQETVIDEEDILSTDEIPNSYSETSVEQPRMSSKKGGTKSIAKSHNNHPESNQEVDPAEKEAISRDEVVNSCSEPFVESPKMSSKRDGKRSSVNNQVLSAENETASDEEISNPCSESAVENMKMNSNKRGRKSTAKNQDHVDSDQKGLRVEDETASNGGTSKSLQEPMAEQTTALSNDVDQNVSYRFRKAVNLNWVTKERGSSSVKRTMKKTGDVMNELELMFFNTPSSELKPANVSPAKDNLDGSPILKTYSPFKHTGSPLGPANRPLLLVEPPVLKWDNAGSDPGQSSLQSPLIPLPGAKGSRKTNRVRRSVSALKENVPFGEIQSANPILLVTHGTPLRRSKRLSTAVM